MEEEVIEIEIEDVEQEIETEEDVIIIKPVLQEKTITPKKIVQEVKPDSEYNGLSKVIVEPYEAITGELTAIQNGTYKAVEQGLDGFDVVNVETEGVDPSEIFNLELATDTSTSQQWKKIIKKFPDEIVTTTGSLYNLFNSFYVDWEIPKIKSKVPITNANNTFQYATLDEKVIKNIEELDFSQCSSFQSFMANTYSKNNKTIPFPQNIDCSNAIKISSMFQRCVCAGELNLKNTGKVTDMSYAFNYCSNLTKIGELDCSSVVNINGAFGNSNSIKEMAGFLNLGKAYLTTANQYNSYYMLDLSYNYNLTHESIINIFNSLYDIKSAGVKTQRVRVNSNTTMKILTDDDIKILTDKGWEIWT